ncbi:MAG: MFS transporter [Streptosporangiaceae bacterium]
MRIDLLRGLPREVGVLTAVAFMIALGFGIVAPALPVFAHQFGVGRTAAAAVISVFAFVRFVSALGSGRLVDRFGERLLLAAGIGIVAVSSLLAGLSQSYVQLVVLRGAGGLGSALFTISAFNLLMRSVGPDLRGRAAGVYQSGFLIGGITGPTLGGLLTAVSIRAPFFVYAGTLAVAGTIGLVFLSRARLGKRPAEEHKEERVTLTEALRSSAYRAALATNLAAGWSFFGVRSAIIPLFVVEGLHEDPLWTGVGFAVASCTQALSLLPAGRLADTRGRRPSMATGILIAATSMAVLAAVPSLPGFLVAMVLLGPGASFLTVASGAIVGDVASGRSGKVVAAYQMSRDAGTITGPLAAGALAQTLSYEASFAASAGILGVAAGLAVTSRETHRT